MHIFHSVFHNEETEVEQQQKKKEDDCWQRAYVRVKAPFLHSLPVYCVDIRSPDDTTTTPDTRLATPTAPWCGSHSFVLFYNVYWQYGWRKRTDK